MTVAPPRISLAPTQPTPPPVPEVARTASVPPNAQPSQPPVRRSASTTGGGSLVDSTAHLFATPDAPLVRRYTDPGGSSMSSLAQPSAAAQPPIRRYRDGGSAHHGEQSGSTESPLVTDELVDRVVERIERRVIEELERRGRSYGRGVR
jgi:hypothetical protein